MKKQETASATFNPVVNALAWGLMPFFMMQAFWGESKDGQRNRLLGTLQKGLLTEDYNACRGAVRELSQNFIQQPEVDGCITLSILDVLDTFGAGATYHMIEDVLDVAPYSEASKSLTGLFGTLAAYQDCEAKVHRQANIALSRIMKDCNISPTTLSNDPVVGSKHMTRRPANSVTPAEFLERYQRPDALYIGQP